MTAFLHFLLRLFFRFRAYATAVWKARGPVLLIPNHVSWLDFLFLGVVLDPDWKFVVSSIAAQYSWVHRKIMLNRRTFPIDPASPYAAKRMAEFLQKGGRLVLFAEGQISRTGTLMKLFDGTGFLLHKTHARVITAYLRGANRVRWSRQPGWRRWWPKVTAHFSPLIEAPALENVSAAQARVKLTDWLRERMVAQQFETEMRFGPGTVTDAILETARNQPGLVVLEDATLQSLSYRRLLVGADLLGSALARSLAPEAVRVGVLLPNVNAMPVVVLGLWAQGKVPAILNFSTGPTVMVACAQLAGIRQIVTSRVFLQKARLAPEPLLAAGLQLIYLEDVRAGIGGAARLGALLRLSLRPRSLGRRPQSAEAPAVILFTSGSEGVPKGVELTHRNLLANIRQMIAV
ncbi:MAG: AMP-binding protein, partial [Limisphaerales bacterium]